MEQEVIWLGAFAVTLAVVGLGISIAYLVEVYKRLRVMRCDALNWRGLVYATGSYDAARTVLHTMQDARHAHNTRPVPNNVVRITNRGRAVNFTPDGSDAA